MKQKTKFKKTEIGKIPEDWKVDILSNHINIIGGGTPKTSKPEYWGGKIPWLSVVDFGNDSHWVYDTEKHITEKGLNESSTKILKKGQIIISARGTVGELAQVTKDMAFNQSCYGIDSKENLTNDFLYFLLKSKIKDVQSKTHGSVFNTITRQTFDQILIPIMGLKEQSAIAKILSDLDSKIELLQQQNKTLEEIGKALFKHWFVDFEFPNEDGKPYKSNGGDMINFEMGKVPNGWRVKKIGGELDTILGGTPSTQNKSYWENGTIAWINSGEINKFRITEPTAYITEEAVNNSATKLMPKGTTVLAITGATLGQVSRIEIDTCANQSIIGIIENKNISSEYIYLWIKYKIIDLISHQTGGAQQHINKNNVNELNILLPTDTLMLKFKNVMKAIFKNISINCFESQNLSQIRDLLLPKLMSGKIRVPVEVRK